MRSAGAFLVTRLSLMAALSFALMLWLPICRATTVETITIPDVLSLGTSPADDLYNFSCYNCQGVVGEVTSCGESLIADEDIAVIPKIPCNNICTKAVRYKMDQKIYVTRNCSESCDPGCYMRRGTGTCWYCCQGNLCNQAQQSRAATFFLVFWSLGICMYFS